jgi:PRC-barrel domain
MQDTNSGRICRFARRNLVAILLLGIAPAIALTPPTPEGQMVKQTVAPGELIPTVGQHLQGPDGSDAGRLWDVLVDSSGRPRVAVIEYGGFAGMGRRKVAVAWRALRFQPGNAEHPIALLLDRSEMGRISDFKGTAGPITFGGPGPGASSGNGS